ncbi:MAG: flagellar motor switch protein FliN [Deltaproteobacteria bacterium]|jgi:flagellar motor switch protein FliN/FliY|nr:flagellar motor switch protein FliN [Deltaproteobacteria bacterium]
MSDADNQDALAAEWAAALGEQKESESGADDGKKSEDQESLAAEWAAAMAGEEQASAKKSKEQSFLSSKAKDASFKDLTEEAKAPRVDSDRRDLDFILDIPLDVSAELGRTSLLINELLQLGQGSVVELAKMAGEPLEVYVNGKLVARGEAVVINEKFGVRLTDIISPIERIKQLG